MGLTAPSPDARATADRLDFLDGVRGLAALYVLLHHACSSVDADRPAHLNHVMTAVTRLLNYAPDAVKIFIVLSGFCLMIPVLRAGGRLKGGLKTYFHKRARRILPPYYAALAMSLLVFLAIPALRRQSGGFSAEALPITPGGVISHLFLVHNFRAQWFDQIDPPMWSLAVEWQIYFVFGLALLPIWRRFGTIVSLIAGVVLGWAIHAALHRRYDFSRPYFVALFAAGMAAAAITLWDGDWDRKLKRTVPWGWVGIVCVSGGILFRSAPLSGPHWARLQSASLPDQILFGGVAALLVWCAAGIGGPRKTVKAFLDSEPVAGLGGFSYSLYLTHYPLLAIFWLWVDKLPISDGWKLTFMVGFGLIVCVPFGYLFYRLFERPFMSSAAKRRHPELAKLTEAAPRL